VKFLVDMALSPELAAWLAGQGHDAVHASTIGMFRSPDTEIMARAKAEGRTVVTADLDYPQLLAMTRAVEPSVILFRDGNWSDRGVIERMRDVFAVLSEDDITQCIIVVERERLRRRRLPLE
jgi:predicted nuclease of predicted toxin-antitoxin system